MKKTFVLVQFHNGNVETTTFNSNLDFFKWFDDNGYMTFSKSENRSDMLLCDLLSYKITKMNKEYPYIVIRHQGNNIGELTEDELLKEITKGILDFDLDRIIESTKGECYEF